MEQEPILHQAVLEDRMEILRSIPITDPIHKQTNHLGFTALELAKLLDKQACVQILAPHTVSKKIKVIHEGVAEPEEYDVLHLEKIFGVRYLSHLKFADYDLLKEAIRNCPLILRTFIGKENRALGIKYGQEIADGYVADTTIKWIDRSIGYGLFLNESLPEGAFIGEYTGLVRPLYRLQPNYNAYSFHYPTRFWSLNYFIIDGLWQGNELRFLNHSDDPNLQPLCLVDRGLQHMGFVTSKAIPAGTELTFNYGVDFWRHRHSEKN